MEQFLGINEIFDYGLYLRGILITLYAVLIFRINLSRLYGSHSTIDFIIFIILGAILGEAIVNNIPLLPSIIVCTIIVLMYRALAFLTFKSHKFGKYIKGDKIFLIKNGKVVKKNLECTRVTINDVLQSLRLQYGTDNLQLIKTAILERGGNISFQMKRTSRAEKTNT
jgi:uncharacterized membrane protein YcaP (DUF421 family)